jgi:hypothetical protein
MPQFKIEVIEYSKTEVNKTLNWTYANDKQELDDAIEEMRGRYPTGTIHVFAHILQIDSSNRR